MSEKVYATPLPTPTDFKIKNDTSDIAVSSVSVAPEPDSASTAVNLAVPSTTWGTTVKSFYTQGTNRVYDLAGNEAATIAEASATTLTENTTWVAVSAVSEGYINATEDDLSVTISGTSGGLADATSVSITLDDSDADATADISKTTTISSNAWSISLTNTEVQGLETGLVTVTASVTTGNVLSGIRTFVYDTTAPTVSATDTKYYGEAAFTNELTGTYKSGKDIYTKVVFTDAVNGVVADNATARPEIFYRIGGTDTQYDIIASGTPASGDCIESGTGVNDQKQYTCRYTVASTDSGLFLLKVGTNTADPAGNTLAATYLHSTALSLDTTAPTATYTTTSTGGVVAGSNTYLNNSDTVTLALDFSEVVTAKPTIQFKNDSTNLGSAVTATADIPAH